MKRNITCLLLLLVCFAQAQPAPSENGKFYPYKDNLRLYYEEFGEGEPLLLLHTFYGTTKQWNSLVDKYAEKFRVIVVDMPGHGRSDIFFKTKTYSHRECAKILLEFMDHLKIKKAKAIGASLGAITLFYANYLQPERFDSFIQIGGQVYFGPEVRRWIREERVDSANTRFVKVYKELHGDEKATLLMRQFWNFQFMHDDPAITPDMLQTFKAKALIVQGDNDFIGLYHALQLHEYIPNSYLWIYPNSGHFPHLVKDNTDDFLNRSIEFLTGKWN